MPRDMQLLGYELLQLHSFCDLHSLSLTVTFGEVAAVSRDGDDILICELGGEAPCAEHFRRIYRALVEKLAQEPL